MASGGPGDHPLTDILHYKLPVFSEEIDALVVEVAKYLPRDRLEKLVNWFSPPEPQEFRDLLESMAADLKAEARARGWEVED
jgi:hypothetical protein